MTSRGDNFRSGKPTKLAVVTATGDPWPSDLEKPSGGGGFVTPSSVYVVAMDWSRVFDVPMKFGRRSNKNKNKDNKPEQSIWTRKCVLSSSASLLQYEWKILILSTIFQQKYAKFRYWGFACSYESQHCTFSITATDNILDSLQLHH